MIYYLHVNGMHHDQYDDIEKCITDFNKLVREGYEVHFQTRDQWLAMTDSHSEAEDAAFHYAQEKFPKLIVEHNIAANAFMAGVDYAERITKK